MKRAENLRDDEKCDGGSEGILEFEFGFACLD